MLASHMPGTGAVPRKHARKIFGATAALNLGVGTDPHPCWILDISDAGARLNIGAQGDLPEFFMLRVTNTGTVSRFCKLAWHRGNEIGVRFVQPS
jgi:PilZ domain